MKDIKNMIVMITGASSGFGAITAKMLVEKGAKVVLGARRADRLETLVQELGEENACFCAGDVTNKDDLIALANAGINKFGKIDALVNNAGIMPLSMLSAGRTDEWDAMIDTNIKGVLYGINAVLNHMLERGNGKIVNISSVAGIDVNPFSAVYSGTKFAVKAISEGLRKETAGKIQVTCIYPGAFQTELATSIKDEAVLEAMMKRFGNAGAIQPADRVAEAIIFALSQEDGVTIADMTIRPAVQS